MFSPVLILTSGPKQGTEGGRAAPQDEPLAFYSRAEDLQFTSCSGVLLSPDHAPDLALALVPSSSFRPWLLPGARWPAARSPAPPPLAHGTTVCAVGSPAGPLLCTPLATLHIAPASHAASRLLHGLNRDASAPAQRPWSLAWSVAGPACTPAEQGAFVLCWAQPLGDGGPAADGGSWAGPASRGRGSNGDGGRSTAVQAATDPHLSLVLRSVLAALTGSRPPCAGSCAAASAAEDGSAPPGTGRGGSSGECSSCGWGSAASLSPGRLVSVVGSPFGCLAPFHFTNSHVNGAIACAFPDAPSSAPSPAAAHAVRPHAMDAAPGGPSATARGSAAPRQRAHTTTRGASAPACAAEGRAAAEGAAAAGCGCGAGPALIALDANVFPGMEGAPVSSLQLSLASLTGGLPPAGGSHQRHGTRTTTASSSSAGPGAALDAPAPQSGQGRAGSALVRCGSDAAGGGGPQPAGAISNRPLAILGVPLCRRADGVQVPLAVPWALVEAAVVGALQGLLLPPPCNPGGGGGELADGALREEQEREAVPQQQQLQLQPLLAGRQGASPATSQRTDGRSCVSAGVGALGSSTRGGGGGCSSSTRRTGGCGGAPLGYPGSGEAYGSEAAGGCKPDGLSTSAQHAHGAPPAGSAVRQPPPPRRMRAERSASTVALGACAAPPAPHGLQHGRRDQPTRTAMSHEAGAPSAAPVCALAVRAGPAAIAAAPLPQGFAAGAAAAPLPQQPLGLPAAAVRSVVLLRSCGSWATGVVLEHRSGLLITTAHLFQGHAGGGDGAGGGGAGAGPGGNGGGAGAWDDIVCWARVPVDGAHAPDRAADRGQQQQQQQQPHRWLRARVLYVWSNHLDLAVLQLEPPYGRHWGPAAAGSAAPPLAPAAVRLTVRAAEDGAPNPLVPWPAAGEAGAGGRRTGLEAGAEGGWVGRGAGPAASQPSTAGAAGEGGVYGSGTPVWAVGHGLVGPSAGWLPLVSYGCVAKVLRRRCGRPTMVVATTATHAGGSGGALLDSAGRLVGLVTSNARHAGGGTLPHLAFCIAAEELEPVVRWAAAAAAAVAAGEAAGGGGAAEALGASLVEAGAVRGRGAVTGGGGRAPLAPWPSLEELVLADEPDEDAARIWRLQMPGHGLGAQLNGGGGGSGVAAVAALLAAAKAAAVAAAPTPLPRIAASRL